MRLRLVGHERGVHAADHGRDAARAQPCREVVDERSIRGDAGEADEVCVERLDVERLDTLVDQHDLGLELLRDERRERRQRERRIAERASEDASLPVHLGLGHDQRDPQGPRRL